MTMTKKEKICAAIIETENKTFRLFDEMNTPAEERPTRFLQTAECSGGMTDPESADVLAAAATHTTSDLEYMLHAAKRRLNDTWDMYVAVTCADTEWYKQSIENKAAADAERKKQYRETYNRYYDHINLYLREKIHERAGTSSINDYCISIGLVTETDTDPDGAVRNILVSKYSFGVYNRDRDETCGNARRGLEINYGGIVPFMTTQDTDQVLFLQILAKFAASTEVQDRVRSLMTEFGEAISKIEDENRKIHAFEDSKFEMFGAKLPLYRYIMDEWKYRYGV